MRIDQLSADRRVRIRCWQPRASAILRLVSHDPQNYSRSRGFDTPNHCLQVIHRRPKHSVACTSNCQKVRAIVFRFGLLLGWHRAQTNLRHGDSLMFTRFHSILGFTLTFLDLNYSLLTKTVSISPPSQKAGSTECFPPPES